MMGLTEKEKEDLEYLQNFWKPRTGDRVKILGTSTVAEIVEILDDSGSQLRLGCHQEVSFVSEVEWMPQPSQFPGVLTAAGFEIDMATSKGRKGGDCGGLLSALPASETWAPETVRFRGLMFAFPKDVADLAELIRGARVKYANHQPSYGKKCQT